MKPFLPIILLSLLVSCSLPIQPQERPTPPPTWSVYFSPKGGATDAIARELDNAKTAILVQAYSFTSAPIAKVLVAVGDIENRPKKDIGRQYLMRL